MSVLLTSFRIIIIILFWKPQKLSLCAQSFNVDTSHPIIYNSSEDVKSGRSSYFGYSVLLRPKVSSCKDSWFIQIGAPRGNLSMSDINEPGVVYRCDFFGPCWPVLVDVPTNAQGVASGEAFSDRRDRSWTGVSMDVKSSEACEKNLVCGHRWANKNLKNPENIAVTFLMNGVCYVEENCDCSTSSRFTKWLPLVNKDKIYSPKPFVEKKSLYYWGLGQAGISCEISDDLSTLTVGAPGIYNWIGGIVRMDSQNRQTEYEKLDNPRKDSYAYIGYKIVSGRFFGKDNPKSWYAVGAPRAADSKGFVFLFQDKDSKVTGSVELIGSSIGEYFGSDLAVTDLNKDGYDDLIVAAPLFSRKEPEEGRIYVYLGTGKGNLLAYSQLINGDSAYARFGSCVSAVGDLDQDGYSDLAVGAPYRNGRRGAVFIYRGSRKGLRSEYSQRILAENLSGTLRGFGISISRGVDVDKNFYNDIAIGSYLSNQVVLLRTRPVISLNPSFKDHPAVLNRDVFSFNISICSLYSGAYVPATTRIWRWIKIDPVHGRAGSSSVRIGVELFRFEPNCETMLVNLDPQLTGGTFGKPLEIQVHEETETCDENLGKVLIIHQDGSPVESDTFSKLCPAKVEADVSMEIPFAGECGADEICNSDLELFCEVLETKNGSYVIGSSDYLTVSMRVKNKGEAALNTELTIYSNLKVSESEIDDWSASESSDNVLKLVTDTTAANTQKIYELRVSLEAIKNGEFKEEKLNISAEVTTTSNEVNLENDHCQLTVSLLYEAHVKLFSASPKTTISVPEKDANDIIGFKHLYEVQKEGDSPTLNEVLTISVPVIYFDGETPVDFVETTLEMPDSVFQYSLRNEITITEDDNTEVIKVDNENHCPPTNRTFFLNCTAPHVKCNNVEVAFPEGIPNGVSSIVTLNVRFNFSKIAPFLSEKDIVYYTTQASLYYEKLLDNHPTLMMANTSVGVFKEETPKQVNVWVIALSVGAGGLVLSVIISGLARTDFFKRKTKKELEALKSAEMTDRAGFNTLVEEQ